MATKPQRLDEELAWALDVAQDRVTLARQLLSMIRSVRIGRLSITWQDIPKRLDPVRLGHPSIRPYDLVEVRQEAHVGDAGVSVNQVLYIQGTYRIVAETRFYSHEFYRQAIAKFESHFGAVQ